MIQLNKTKTYIATFEFGYLTDSLDATGKVIDTCSKIPTIDEIKAKEGWCHLCAHNEKEQALLNEGKEVTQYIPINEKVSFGKDINTILNMIGNSNEFPFIFELIYI